MAQQLYDLAGYPMVMAVSQDAINAQMAKVYGQSTRNTDMFPHVPWNLGPEDGSWSLTVDQFAAPEVDFDTPNEHECRLKMKITSGTFSWFTIKLEGGKPKVDRVNMKLDGLMMYLTTKMNEIKHTEWCDELFEVQTLFANLHHIHRIQLDMPNTQIVNVAGERQASLETILVERITELATTDANSQLLFGDVEVPIVPASVQSSGPLKPSACTYSTVKIKNESGGYKSGGLNYLLLLDGKDFPTEKEAGVFQSSPAFSAGMTMLVVSDATVLDKIVKPLLEKRWPGIKLQTHGSSKPVKIDLTEFYASVIMMEGEGGHLNRARNATLTNCKATVSDSQIVIDYTFNTSIYGVLSDTNVIASGKKSMEFGEGPNRRLISKVIDQALTLNNKNGLYTNWTTGNREGNGLTAIAGYCVSGNEDSLGAMMLPGEAVWSYAGQALHSELYLAASYPIAEARQAICSVVSGTLTVLAAAGAGMTVVRDSTGKYTASWSQPFPTTNSFRFTSPARNETGGFYMQELSRTAVSVTFRTPTGADATKIQISIDAN